MADTSGSGDRENMKEDRKRHEEFVRCGGDPNKFEIWDYDRIHGTNNALLRTMWDIGTFDRIPAQYLSQGFRDKVAQFLAKMSS